MTKGSSYKSDSLSEVQETFFNLLEMNLTPSASIDFLTLANAPLLNAAAGLVIQYPMLAAKMLAVQTFHLVSLNFCKHI